VFRAFIAKEFLDHSFGRENAPLPSSLLASIIGRNRVRYHRGLPCAEPWRRDWNHVLTGSLEPLQGLFSLPKAPKTRGCRPEETGQNTATASICSRRTVKKFRTRLRRIASRCRGIQRHAICLMLDCFLPVDDLSRLPRQLCIAVDAVNMRINLSEISLRSLTTLTRRIS
jgi:hypothetical protein